MDCCTKYETDWPYQLTAFDCAIGMELGQIERREAGANATPQVINILTCFEKQGRLLFSHAKDAMDPDRLAMNQELKDQVIAVLALKAYLDRFKFQSAAVTRLVDFVCSQMPYDPAQVYPITRETASAHSKCFPGLIVD